MKYKTDFQRLPGYQGSLFDLRHSAMQNLPKIEWGSMPRELDLTDYIIVLILNSGYWQ